MSPANDPKLTSWVPVPALSDFPVQNLPFGIFRKRDFCGAGVAIGDHVVDLVLLHSKGFFESLNLPAGIFAQRTLNDFFALGRGKVGEVRERISLILRSDNEELRSHPSCKDALFPRSE